MKKPKKSRPFRRALSMPSSGGATDRDGDKALSGELAEALKAASGGGDIARSLTHSFHSYPARMHPATARAAVALLRKHIDCDEPVLFDPFCGSGTSLVEARYAGIKCTGADLSPLAVLIASAKTWTASAADRKRLVTLAEELLGRALAEGRAARRSGYTAPPDRKRAGGAKLVGWFPRHIRRELEFLYSGIRQAPAPYQDLMLAALSSTLHKVSYRASDTDPRKVHKNIARGAPARLFRDRIQLLNRGLAELAFIKDVAIPQVHERDARQPAPFRCDMILTSPPYPGTYDYAHHHELRFAFLELDRKPLTQGELGPRRAQQGPGLLDSWRRSTARWLEQAAATLRPGGLFAVLAGDSVAGNRAVYAADELLEAAGPCLEYVARASQTRPALGGRERRVFAKRRKSEHLILLRRIGDDVVGS